MVPNGSEINNEGRKLYAQVLRTDYIRPNAWIDRPRWRLVIPLYFKEIVVPVGFETDMGTIPRLLWTVFDPINRYAPATIVHDFALTIMSREEADTLFRDALEEMQISPWRIKSMHQAVRQFGRSKLFFKKNISKIKGLKDGLFNS